MSTCSDQLTELDSMREEKKKLLLEKTDITAKYTLVKDKLVRLMAEDDDKVRRFRALNQAFEEVKAKLKALEQESKVSIEDASKVSIENSIKRTYTLIAKENTELKDFKEFAQRRIDERNIQIQKLLDANQSLSGKVEGCIAVLVANGIPRPREL